LYIVEIIVIVLAIAAFIIGSKRKQSLWRGIGIGALIAFVILGIPDFIEGFQQGFGE
jgi:hypothetical protein